MVENVKNKLMPVKKEDFFLYLVRYFILGNFHGQFNFMVFQFYNCEIKKKSAKLYIKKKKNTVREKY